MIEIEAKFKLSANITRDKLITVLESHLVVPISVKHQIDKVFLLPEQVDTPITLKIEGQTKLASDEYEFTVDDGDMARQMLTALGWQEVVTVDKVRLESKTEDYTICVDEVAGLGLFIELEVLAGDEANTDNIQQQMYSFLKSLNIDGELWKTPYDTSIRNLRKGVS